jgi:phosphatidylinositol-4,5-bisphosphate 3-kinase catalytic subunit alpha/beta/delta
MLSSGMTELRSEEDLDYLRRSFAIDLSEEDATKLFTQLVHQSLNTKTTQLNFAVHLLAKPGK